jgi:hypothetical protein
MTSKSKSKGNRFEHEVAAHFNTVYETKAFARTPSSGAMVGQSNFAKRQGLEDHVINTLSSDLIVPQWFKYCVECKNYKEPPDFNTVLASGSTLLDGWLEEALRDATNTNTLPILCWKVPRRGWFYSLPEQLIRSFVNMEEGYGKEFSEAPHIRYNGYCLYHYTSFEAQSESLKNICVRPYYDNIVQMVGAHNQTELPQSQTLS